MIRETNVTFEVDGITEAQWNSLLDRAAGSSLYQTWAYGAVSWGENRLSHLVVRKGGAPVAMAQVRIAKAPLSSIGIAYVRWGPVMIEEAVDHPTTQAIVEGLVEEYVQRRRLALRVLPFVFGSDPGAAGLSAALAGAGLSNGGGGRPYHTLRIDLSASLDELRRRLDRKWRNQLNAAERNGLEVAEGTSPDLFAEFSGLYREMMARKQFETSVSVEQFGRIHERLPVSQKMLVMIGRQEGRPVSGLVASTVGTTAIYLLGATGDDGLKAKASYLLQWRLLGRLKELGCRWYDLGGVNPETNPGVYHFKKGMGGEEVVQVGRFELSPSRVGELVLSVGERLEQARRRALASVRRVSPR